MLTLWPPPEELLDKLPLDERVAVDLIIGSGADDPRLPLLVPDEKRRAYLVGLVKQVQSLGREIRPKGEPEPAWRTDELVKEFERRREEVPILAARAAQMRARGEDRRRRRGQRVLGENLPKNGICPVTRTWYGSCHCGIHRCGRCGRRVEIERCPCRL